MTGQAGGPRSLAPLGTSRPDAVRVSAAHVAVAIVAASKILRTDPSRVFEEGRMHPRTRILAAAGCCARLGLGKADAGRLFKLKPQRLAPSMLVKETITTEQLLEVAEALESAGLTTGDRPGDRFRSPWEPEAAAARESRRTQVPAAEAQAPRKPGQDCPSPSRSAPDAAPAPVPKRRGRPPGSGAFKRQEAGRAGARARARPSTAALAPIAGLKPVSANIARWSGYFLEADWRLSTVADLFEVCPVALLDALDPQELRA